MKPTDWLKAAELDIKAAQSMIKDNLAAPAAFHAQQAAEKAVKAKILQSTKRIPKVHDLLRLAEEAQVGHKIIPQLQFLNRFYHPTRYPDAIAGSLEAGLPSINEASKALKDAETVLKSIKQNLV